MASNTGTFAALSAAIAAAAIAPPVAPVLNNSPIFRPANRLWIVLAARFPIMPVVGPVRSRNLNPRAVMPSAGAFSSI